MQCNEQSSCLYSATAIPRYYHMDPARLKDPKVCRGQIQENMSPASNSFGYKDFEQMIYFSGCVISLSL